MTITIGGQSNLARGPFDPKRQYQFLRGFNPGVSTATVPETVWPNPADAVAQIASAGDQISTVSDNANDSSAGTGARTMTLFGVDSNFDPVTEVITLNGTTPVLSVASDFIFVNAAVINTAGTSKGNEGLISMTIGGTLVNIIAVLQGATQTTAQVLLNPLIAGTVPHLFNVVIAVGRVNAALATTSLVAESTITIFSQEISISSDGGPFVIDIQGPVPFFPGTFVHADVIDVSANNTAVNANLQFIYL